MFFFIIHSTLLHSTLRSILFQQTYLTYRMLHVNIKLFLIALLIHLYATQCTRFCIFKDKQPSPQSKFRTSSSSLKAAPLVVTLGLPPSVKAATDLLLCRWICLFWKSYHTWPLVTGCFHFALCFPVCPCRITCCQYVAGLFDCQVDGKWYA